MSSPSRVPDVALGTGSRPQTATLGWALRRAAFGLLLLIIMVVFGAWLLYASIDPDEASASSAPAQGGYAAPEQ